MTSPRSRNDIRLDRVIVRLRQVDRDLYRLTATIGRAIEYRRRAALASKIASAADLAGGGDILVLARLNHLGRWSILDLIRDASDVAAMSHVRIEAAEVLPTG